jgi:hypothetical protein
MTRDYFKLKIIPLFVALFISVNLAHGQAQPLSCVGTLCGLPILVTNSDGSISVNQTNGSVVVTLNLANPNVWTATQIMPGIYGCYLGVNCTLNLEGGVSNTGTGQINLIAGALTTAGSNVVVVKPSSGTANYVRVVTARGGGVSGGSGATQLQILGSSDSTNYNNPCEQLYFHNAAMTTAPSPETFEICSEGGYNSSGFVAVSGSNYNCYHLYFYDYQNLAGIMDYQVPCAVGVASIGFLTLKQQTLTAYMLGGYEATIASATTITPTTPLVTISGSTPIVTITLPTNFTGGCFDILATGAWTTTTAGNIQAVMTASANTSYRACYWTSLGKWTIK